MSVELVFTFLEGLFSTSDASDGRLGGLAEGRRGAPKAEGTAGSASLLHSQAGSSRGGSWGVDGGGGAASAGAAGSASLVHPQIESLRGGRGGAGVEGLVVSVGCDMLASCPPASRD